MNQFVRVDPRLVRMEICLIVPLRIPMQIVIALPLMIALTACHFPQPADDWSLGQRFLAILLVWGIARVIPSVCFWAVERSGLIERPRMHPWSDWYPLAAWAVTSLFITMCTCWSQAVQEVFGPVTFLSSLLILGPHLFGLILIWLGPSVSASRLRRRNLASWWAALQRHGAKQIPKLQWGMLPVLVPMGTVLAIRDLLETSPFWSDSSTALQVLLLSAASMATVMVLFPVVLSKWLRIKPIKDPTLRHAMEQTVEKLRLRVHSVAEWDTGYRVPNAMVLGCLPFQRRVLLSDVLCVALRPGELYSVFLHEAGHIVRGHLWWRLLVVLISLESIAVAIQSLPNDIVNVEHSLNWEFASGVLLVMTLIIVTAVLLGYVSRTLEFEADRFVLERTDGSERSECSGTSQDLQVDVFSSPHEHLIGAISRTAELSGMPLSRVTWLHPSIQERIQRIRWHLHFPGTSKAARTRTAILKGSLLATCILLSGVLLTTV